MTKLIKMPASIILTLLLLLSTFTMVPVSVNAAITYAPLTAVRGSESVSSDENYDKLLDGDLYTKWVCEALDNHMYYVIFKTNERVSMGSYSLTTCDDTVTHPERNWKSWRIYGANFANDSDAVQFSSSWNLITSVTDDDKLQAAKWTSYYYNLDAAAAPYMYYMISVTPKESAGYIQMSRFRLGISNDTCEVDGVLFSSDMKTLISYPSDKSDSTYVIPNTVTTIGNAAFDDCDNLNNIIIPKSVTTIGDSSFYDCGNLTNVIIPSSVGSIGEHAFENCANLTKATFLSAQTEIGEYAFDGCNNSLVFRGDDPSVAKTYAEASNGAIAFVAFSDYLDFDKERGTITAYYDYDVLDVVIPPQINGQYVYYIAGGAFAGKDVTSVVIPDSVTYIGAGAFANCGDLTSVTLGSGVKQIDDSAFYGCTSLTTFNVPGNVKRIGVSAFRGCSNLSSISLPSSVEEIGKYAFRDCTSLTGITIPNNVEEIDEGTFDGCTSLSSVTLGNNVGVIGDSAFRSCSNLSSIPLPSGVEAIGDNAFQYCSSLTSLTLPVSVNDIGDDAFSGCYNITALSVSGNGKFDYSTLPLSNVTNLTVTGTAVNDSTFSGCYSLESVTIANTVKSIGYEAFYDCYCITSLTLGSGLETIGDYAFEYCSGITSVTIPDNVKSIGYGAFYYCSSLSTAVIGDGVETIGGNAFCSCGSLSDLTIGSGVKNIENYAFYYCSNLTSVTLGRSVESIGGDTFYGCYYLENIYVDANNPNFSSQNGVLYNKNKTELVKYPMGKSGSFTIPNTVKRIGDSAFNNCSNLSGITIPDSVESIGEYAFYYCSGLSSITIPDSVQSIGSSAFYGCYNATNLSIGSGIKTIEYQTFGYLNGLTSVTVPDNVETIGSGAFQYCYNLSDVTLSEGIKVIEYNAFTNSSFASVTIPESVTSIGSYAFAYNYNLADVTFLSSKTEIDEDAFYSCYYPLNFYGFDPSPAKNYADNSYGSITFVESEDTSSDFTFTLSGNSATVTEYKGSNTQAEIPPTLGGCPVTTITDDAFASASSLSKVIIPRSVTSIGSSAFENCPNVTICGYDGSAAEAYASTNNLPFILMVKTNAGKKYTYSPLTNTQTKDSGDTSFGLSQANYGNIELLGVQQKVGSNGNDMRFIAVVNEGIIKDANEGGDIVDYGFVVAKSDYKSVAQTDNSYLSKVTLGAPKTKSRSCFDTENSFSGNYGRKSIKTKYKYVTLAIEDVPDDQGFVVRFYIKTKSGKVYYANYNSSYAGCITNYSQISAIVEGENAVRYMDDWDSLAPFADN